MDIESKHGKASMVWVDLETTGLNPLSDVILEIAVAVTDKDGKILGSFESLIDYNLSPNYLESKMSKKILEMHTKSGLWDAWQKMHAENQSRTVHDNPLISLGHKSRIEKDIVAFLVFEFKLDYGLFPMCGNSVHFDRKFLEYRMESVSNLFHYRNVDISTLKMLCQDLNPKVLKACQDMLEESRATRAQHRAMNDLRSSIDEYIFYKDNFLFVE